jgi:hypothetical protein
MRHDDLVLHVASGGEGELEGLLRRLSSDFRPARERVDDKLAKTVAFHSRRTR